MDSRLLHLTYLKAFASVAWDRHGEHEYVLVGDGLAVEKSVLQALICRTFSMDTLWLDAAVRWGEGSINGLRFYKKPENPWRRAAQILHAGKFYE